MAGNTTSDRNAEREAERKADEARRKKAQEDAAKSTGGKKDPDDPANQAGNTGNSPTLGPGVKKTPTPAEDDEAKEEAKQAGETSDALLGEGSYRKAARVESDAIKHGASLLGKEAVVVQAADGTPTVARRGMLVHGGMPSSATNPALAANNTVASAAPPPPQEKTAEGEEPDPNAPVPVADLYGTGPQPAAG